MSAFDPISKGDAFLENEAAFIMNEIDASQIVPKYSVKNKILFGVMFAVILIAAFVFHSAKGQGLNPAIFPDEKFYSQDVRLFSLTESRIPNYLFNAIYGVVDLAGNNFLDAARIMNAFFFALTGPFLYLIARMACGPILSLVIMALALFSPLSIYTLYFTPESSYIPLFWMLAWMLMKIRDYSVGAGLLLGAHIGVMSLIKVHGIFLLPCLLLFFLMVDDTTTPRLRAFAKARCSIAATAAFGAVKFGVGYALAGSQGLSLLGNTYSSMVDIGVREFDIGGVIAGFLYNGFGMALGLGLVYGLPLAIALSFACSPRNENGISKRFALLALSFIVPLASLSVLFSATVDYFAPSGFDAIRRLLERYFVFLFPMNLILAGFALGQRTASVEKSFYRYFPAPFLLLGLYAATTNMTGYTLNHYFDCPVIGGIFCFSDLGVRTPNYVLCFLALLSCALWMFHRRWAAVLFLLVFLPLYNASSYYFNQRETMVAMALPNPFIKVAADIRNKIGDDFPHLTILDESWTFGDILVYYLDDKNIGLNRTAKGSSYANTAIIPPGSRWVLLFGRQKLPEELVAETIIVPWRDLIYPEYTLTLNRLITDPPDTENQ